MEDRLQGRIRELARQLVSEERVAFRRARTLRELEDLVVEIGDELACQLANADVTERAARVAEAAGQVCPECGRECAVDRAREPLILQGRRGEIEYSEPRCHCRSCRRDFFPSGARTSAAGA